MCDVVSSASLSRILRVNILRVSYQSFPDQIACAPLYSPIIFERFYGDVKGEWMVLFQADSGGTNS